MTALGLNTQLHEGTQLNMAAMAMYNSVRTRVGHLKAALHDLIAETEGLDWEVDEGAVG